MVYLQGQGGTTTTSETARRFFNSNLRKKLVAFAPEQYREDVEQIIQNHAVMLRYFGLTKD